jgi:CheY-like chemotaxis protein
MVMPDIDGLETMIAIRAVSVKTSLIAMTGVEYPDFDPLRAAVELGADAALRKPFKPEDLAAAISRFTNGAARTMA